MARSNPAELTRTAAGGRFLVPRESRLGWRLLNPLARARTLPAPFDTKPTFYLFWARNALYHGLEVLGLAPGDRILVPAFHCASLVEPLIQYGATVGFYEIDTACSVDLDSIRAQITERTRAVLAIHYFGFPGPMRELRALCDQRGLFLIEDCAHLLAGRGEGGVLGEFGDISVFSCRKFLPVYDGGQLVVNNPSLDARLRLTAPSPLFRLRVWKNIVDKLIDDASVPSLRRLSGVARRLSHAGRQLASRLGGGGGTSLTVNNYTSDFDRSSLDMPMSAPSRRILRTVDIHAVTETRRRNYRTVLAATRDLPGVVPLFPELPDGVCPWVFPFVARGRMEFHLRLRARGVPATTWGDVVHRELPLEAFPDARFLYENLIFLPIHQSLTAGELEAMIGILVDELSRTP